MFSLPVLKLILSFSDQGMQVNTSIEVVFDAKTIRYNFPVFQFRLHNFQYFF